MRSHPRSSILGRTGSTLEGPSGCSVSCAPLSSGNPTVVRVGLTLILLVILLWAWTSRDGPGPMSRYSELLYFPVLHSNVPSAPNIPIVTCYLSEILLWKTIFKKYLFLGVLGLHCFAWAFSGCGTWPLHCGGSSCCGAWAPGCAGFSSCGSQA